MGGACSSYGGEEKHVNCSGEGKRPLGGPRWRWEDNVKIDLQNVGCCGMGWMDLAQDRDRWQALVNAVMNIWIP